ncbi:MAG: L-threonylcarbamoyladenylate synthase [Candidatus Babeliales bacterium]
MKSFQLWWQDPATVSRMVKALQQGQVVVGTSDTVVGLLADATQEGFQALNQIKGRVDKPYVVLIASSDKLTHFVQTPLTSQVQKLIASCWPGPLTLVLPTKTGIGQFLAPSGSIALRVPKHEGLLALLPHFEGVYSTSANLSGHPVPATLDELDPGIREKVAYVVGDKNEVSTVVPSTIIDCTGEQLKVIREGAYSIAELEKMVSHTIGY